MRRMMVYTQTVLAPANTNCLISCDINGVATFCALRVCLRQEWLININRVADSAYKIANEDTKRTYMNS